MNAATQEILKSFLIGEPQLHPDVNMNAQMNWWAAWARDPSMLGETASVAPKIQGNADWIRAFSALADQATCDGQDYRAAHYCRAAEFIMEEADPRRLGFRMKGRGGPGGCRSFVLGRERLEGPSCFAEALTAVWRS